MLLMIPQRRRRRLSKATLPGLALALGLSAGLAAFASGSPAQAADPTPLYVVGTSDVSDSNLVQAVIKPLFEQAYPQYTLNYIAKGTGAAITYAEAGSAAALIVHAASLENQFVGSGYSYEPAGRALFYGDFVLAGDKTDPAAVDPAAVNDIVTAYEKVAAAGAAGTANFVSRGGTPGTTVAEHQIWALTTGVTLCQVSAANGGGASPSTTTGACPSTISYPSWYHATGLTQGPNVTNADACNYSGSGCYVFTDRGTYDYLNSQNLLTNLDIVTRDNSAGAVGGSTALINSFHGYVVNPAKFSGTNSTDVVGATDLLDWITSPAGQTAISGYLAAAESPSAPPFLGDAAPVLTGTAPAAQVKAGSPVTISGTLKNKVPGTPTLSGEKVTLVSRPVGSPTATPTVVATTTTGTSEPAAYSFTVKPTRTLTYSVQTAGIQKVEIPSPVLDPAFSDLLQPTSTTVGTTTVRSNVVLSRYAGAGKKGLQLLVKGAVSPKAPAGAKIALYASHPGSPVKLVGVKALAAGAGNYNDTFPLGKGTWKFQVGYSANGYFVASGTPTQKVTLP